ncbi:MAG: polyamine aminopropyltransferase [Balneolaceae bacterium]
MSIEYKEYYSGRTGLSVGVKRLLFARQSDYQLVEVFETDTWGNLLTVDGLVMLSEKDEFVYHEMISHVGTFTHPSPGRVLIIGGGDGGTAREVMKHPAVKTVDMVEIDKTVVTASKQFLPRVGDFGNPKLNVIYEDGISFVRQASQSYDLIIVDGSDPVGPAEGLFEAEFLSCCDRILDDHGVLVTQTESPWVASHHPAIKKVYRTLNRLFRHAEMYLCHIPLYPAGMWSMMIASKGNNPLEAEVLARADRGIGNIPELRYYNGDVHRAAFALPGFVKDIVREN